jgi:adenosyl cobinamide kinase/adenosyl cobinamide phosphate guanylyltransferase
MHPKPTRDLTFVLGGVRSGKSGYALQLAERARRVPFLATAERREDEEMRRKIQRHRALGRRYRDLLGEIKQRVASIADHVVLMVAGLPLTLKSSLSTEVRL